MLSCFLAPNSNILLHWSTMKEGQISNKISTNHSKIFRNIYFKLLLVFKPAVIKKFDLKFLCFLVYVCFLCMFVYSCLFTHISLPMLCLGCKTWSWPGRQNHSWSSGEKTYAECSKTKEKVSEGFQYSYNTWFELIQV